jgi:hypothetical protein
MRTVYATVLALFITGTQALASAGGGDGEGLGLFAMFFIAFGILIILFQFIPGLMMLGGMLAALFKSGEKKPGEALAGNDKTE